VKVNKKLNGDDWDECVESTSENDRTRNIQIDLGSGMKKHSLKSFWIRQGILRIHLIKPSSRNNCYENGVIPFAILKEGSTLDDWLEDYRCYFLSNKGMHYEEVKERKKNIKKIFDPWFNFKFLH
jgi:hypothetical protein